MAKLKVWKCFSVWMVLVLVVGLGAALVPASPVKAATINGPGDYANIQEAINAASPGDTINVAAGTYDVATMITVNEAGTIMGPASGGATSFGATWCWWMSSWSAAAMWPKSAR